MAEQKSTNITWHEGQVSREQRHSVLGQKGATIWFTGLSASGKSTVSIALEKALNEAGQHAYCLDGDNIRHGLNKNLGFSPEDRTENIRRIGEVAKLFADSGAICQTSFISPYRADRDIVRALHDAAGLLFIEVYVNCPLEVAEERDPKGLYKKARAGEIKGFTGIDAPYEEPENPGFVLRTDQLDLVQSVQAILELLKDKGLLTSKG
jgi:adenylylsulfate kinase